MPEKVPQIFISYVSEDIAKARELYAFLQSQGHMPWMDKENIIGGEQWELALRKAIRSCDLFIACCSTHSVTKRGYFQKEIRQALDMWQERLPSDIFLIPVRLDDCKVPEELRPFQWIDLFADGGYDRLATALKEGVTRLGLLARPTVHDLKVDTPLSAKSFPLTVNYPRFDGRLPVDAERAVNAALQDYIARLRAEWNVEIDDEFLEREDKTHWSLEAWYVLGVVAPSFVSIRFDIGSYLGGAHGNYNSRSFNYWVDQKRELAFADLFTGPDAVRKIKDYAIATLIQEMRLALDVPPDEKWITEGVEEKIENTTFLVTNEHSILLNFDPYQVAAYALGPQVVTLPFVMLRQHLRLPGPLSQIVPPM